MARQLKDPIPAALSLTCRQRQCSLPLRIQPPAAPGAEYAVFTHRDHISTIRRTMHTFWSKWRLVSPTKRPTAPFSSRYCIDPNGGYCRSLAKSMQNKELEHFPAKWIPVRVAKMRPNKELEPRSDSIGTEKALERWHMNEVNASVHYGEPFDPNTGTGELEIWLAIKV